MSSSNPWSAREIFASASILGNALEFSVVEFLVPQGWKFILRGFEVTQACRVLVSDQTFIASASAPAIVPTGNPPSLLQGVTVGRRADAGLFGYIARTISGFQAYNWDTIIDSSSNQRLVWIGQTVNTALEVSFSGKLVEDSFDAQLRITT